MFHSRIADLDDADILVTYRRADGGTTVATFADWNALALWAIEHALTPLSLHYLIQEAGTIRELINALEEEARMYAED